MKDRFKKLNSIHFRLLFVFILFLGILLLIFYLNIQQIQTASYQRVLDTVSANTSAVLNSVNSSLAESETSVQILSSFVPSSPLSEDSSVWFFFYKDLQTTIGLLESKDYQYTNLHYFVYNHAQNYFLRSNKQSVNVYEEKALGVWLADSSDVKDKTWQDIVFENTHYYIYTVRKGDFYLGAFVSAPVILEKFILSSSDETEFALTGLEDSYLITRPGDKTLDSAFSGYLSAENTPAKRHGPTFMRYPSKYGFTVITATDRLEIDGNVFLSTGPVIIIISGILIFIFYLLTFRGCIKPLSYLRYAFSRVSSGDLSFRMREDMFTNEYNELAKSFNLMVREIKTLRLSYYEEKILQQQAENRYLRAITYPHFLLNNLNLINNFAYESNEQGIHDVVLNLSSYLRYFITADYEKHTLKNDVESAKSYLNLNMLAYPGRLSYSFETDDSLLNLSFPPLIISTIVENCIKHGLVGGCMLNIDISLRKEHTADGEYLLFTCSDSGPGFPDSVIDSINSKEPPTHKTSHVGLMSIKNTLQAQYKNNVDFRIGNTPSGVAVSIRVDMACFTNDQKGRVTGNEYTVAG